MSSVYEARGFCDACGFAGLAVGCADRLVLRLGVAAAAGALSARPGELALADALGDGSTLAKAGADGGTAFAVPPTQAAINGARARTPISRPGLIRW
jgi:hypothetical protein